MSKKETLRQIGENIAKFRNRIGLRQEDLANKLKMSRVSIVNIEAGRQSIPIYRIPILCKILECSPNYIFKGETK